MDTNDTPTSQDEIQRRARRNRWIIVIVIICLLALLCVLAFCILGVIGIAELTKPQTNAVFYQDASISPMIMICESGQYYSPEDWMLPVPGANIVTAIYYSKSSPAPNAFYAYDFYLQLDPELLIKEQELTFPSEGITTFLFESHSPYWVCGSGFQGSITILEYTPTMLKALLDVHGIIDGNDWEYNGEVEFNLSPLPAMGVKKENGQIILSHALAE